MRYGFVVPYADSRDFAAAARLGEDHDWDAVFTWEAVFGVDAWVTLAAAAMATERIRLGTLLTPASRVRPWDLASRVGTVDRLSGGRVVMSVGLGALHEGWTAFEPDEGRAVRARKLDESLAGYAGLLGGQPFSHAGEHYPVRPTDFALPDPPVQRPHPPVWVVGALVPGRARQPSLERAARWQGLLPAVAGGPEGGLPPDALAQVVDRVRQLRTAAGLPWDGYDVVVEGDSHGGFGAVRADPDVRDRYAAAGATWWVESWWDLPRGPEGLAELRRRVALGAPRS